MTLDCMFKVTVLGSKVYSSELNKVFQLYVVTFLIGLEQSIWQALTKLHLLGLQISGCPQVEWLSATSHLVHMSIPTIHHTSIHY